MSIIPNNNMGTPFLHEFKKQASFFLKEKIKTARLALTDVTPTELLTEEVTNGNPWAPDTRTMGLISRAAFEIDDYCRIVGILHKRLARYDKKYWRESYKALILLEHLLTHGPESIVTEFQSDTDVIRQLGSFQYIDERGFNWGLTVRKKSERVLQLLEKGELYKQERHRARKLTRGIEGFGSFSQRSSSSAVDGNSKESPANSFGRCNSHYADHSPQEQVFPSLKKGDSTDGNEQTKLAFSDPAPDNQLENSNPQGNTDQVQLHRKNADFVRQPLKENMSGGSSRNGRELNPIPVKKLLLEELHEEDPMPESDPLLGSQKDKPRIEFMIEEDHPFINLEHQSVASLLSVN